MHRHVPGEVVVRVEDLPALQAGERLGLPPSRRRIRRARLGRGRGRGDLGPCRRLLRTAAAFPALWMQRSNMMVRLRDLASFNNCHFSQTGT